MSDPLTTDQFRILRNARDGVKAIAELFQPRSYVLDVEMLVRDRLLAMRNGAFVLTPLGAAFLAAPSVRDA
jgi:hypothetical protein